MAYSAGPVAEEIESNYVAMVASRIFVVPSSAGQIGVIYHSRDQITQVTMVDRPRLFGRPLSTLHLHRHRAFAFRSLHLSQDTSGSAETRLTAGSCSKTRQIPRAFRSKHGDMDNALPIPPPPLHIRGEMADCPGTPSFEAFTSPQRTPQGSPSKHMQPPGAFDLPNVFENAMRLAPTIGSPRQSRQPQTPTSPSKATLHPAEDTDYTIQDVTALGPPSPTRKANKENTPPSTRPGLHKDASYINHAAMSRQELYKSREESRQPPVPQRLSPEDQEKLRKPAVKRLANVTQLCMSDGRRWIMANEADFLDYYYDLFTYVHNRQSRHAHFKAENPPPPSTPEPEYSEMLDTYLGRERANLRKRRTRLRQGDFQILTQVGQGGYGQVYLAQKKDTREVCALKVMSKKLLFKLDEVRHVLTERDILTNAKSEWLVRLLYAFQDERSIYLAMVRAVYRLCGEAADQPGIRPWRRFPHAAQQCQRASQPARPLLRCRDGLLRRLVASARLYPP